MITETLTLQTCALRPLATADAPSIAELANNPKVAALMRNDFPSPYTLSDAETFIAYCIDPECTGTHLAIEVDGRAIGLVGLMAGVAGEVHHRTAEIGYWIGELFWGRGIVTEAVAAFTDHVFATTGYLRLFATVFDGNPASCRVLEKCGFVKEGVMRAFVEKNGEILDAHLYAKLSLNLN